MDWPVGNPFDLAVSAISIHNLGEFGAMAACYRGIAWVIESVPVFRQGLIFNHQFENRDEIQGPLYRRLQRFGGARPP